MQKTLLTAALAAFLLVPAAAVAQQTPAPQPEPVPTEPAPVPPAPEPTEPAAPPAAAALAVEAEDEVVNVLEVARAAGTFTTLLRAIEAAGLTDTLSAAGPYTLFAPTDEAFARLPEGALDALLADPATLRELLLGHVIVARVSADDVRAQESARVASGADVGVTSEGERLLIGGATVVQRDISAANGVIHAIDQVIIPAAGSSEARP